MHALSFVPPRLLAPLLAMGLAACAPAVTAPTLPASQAAPVAAKTTTPGATLPKASIKPYAEVFHGTTVVDPYHHFENIADPEVAAWMKAHSDYAHTLLRSISGRDRLLARLEELDRAAGALMGDVSRSAGDRWFYEKRGAGDNQFKLVMRRGLSGAEKVLVDPEVWQKRTGKPHAISYYRASPNGRYVAFAISASGSEAATLHVIDTQDGSERVEPIERVDQGGVYWQDERHFFLNRLQKMEPGMPETAKYQKSSVYVVEVDRGLFPQPVFGPATPGVTLAPDHFGWVEASSDGRHLIARVFNGVQREIAVWVAPVSALGGKAGAWRRIVDFSDRVVVVAQQGGSLYLLSQQDAPRGKLLRIDLARPELARAQELLPMSDRVLTGLAAAADGLYAEQRDGNVKRLQRRAWDAGGRFEEVKLPVEGSFELQSFEAPDLAYDARLPGVVIALQGWVDPRRLMLIDRNGVRDTQLQPRVELPGFADITVTEVEAPSWDGAKVPMSIIHRRGLALDGRNPVLLNAYASYGLTIEPRFSPTSLAWLEAGGIYAYANPRGSGARGDDWYRAGKGANKPNTWKDFIACGEWLVRERWTSPARLAISGGSAGGITVGRAMTERPDLFAAVMPAVGTLDQISFERTANGATNVPEFGSVATPEGFRALLAMSSYHQVKDGTAYPAVLLTHGVNDPRVEVWNSTKMAARLLAASTSGKPVLLRLDYDGGHGIGSTKRQQLESRADALAFLGWQMGLPGYAPKPAAAP